MSRLSDLQRFYCLLDRLAETSGVGTVAEMVRLAPDRGVYFFFEPGEERRESGRGPRVVRVGTHALSMGSRSTLRQRLTQHQGTGSGRGNHRGSIFRLLAGQAILARDPQITCASWGIKGDAGKAALKLGSDRASLKAAEDPIEQRVSSYIGTMTVALLSVPDQAGPCSLRATIERNSIALLSNHGRTALDAPSSDWLGRHSNRPLVQSSGLWNQRHVEEHYDSRFLDQIEELIDAASSPECERRHDIDQWTSLLKSVPGSSAPSRRESRSARHFAGADVDTAEAIAARYGLNPKSYRQQLRTSIAWYRKPQDWTFPVGSDEWRDMIAIAEKMGSD